jgi:hypothetical protein
VKRHELLSGLHQLLQPRTYLEIGVQTGRSITLSRTSTIGVDPAFSVINEVSCDLQLVRSTSDEFFARKAPLAHFPEPVIDLAFIDGMHLSEYALRDLINVERHTHPASVIVLDDMLPRHVDEAGRGREAAKKRRAWAGDVYKVVSTVRTLRPDVLCLEMDTAPTGTLVLLAPDASSNALTDAYDDVVEEYVVPDPQTVPAEVLERTRAMDPARFLAAPIWPDLRRLRRLPARRAAPEVRRVLASAGLRTPG